MQKEKMKWKMQVMMLGEIWMSYEKNNHLDTDQIIRALVDRENLTSEEKFHFATCNICNNEKIKIEEQLFSLSQKAKNISPKPVRK